MCAAKAVQSENLTEETVEYVWKILNHHEVVSNVESLVAAKQFFDFTSNGGKIYKWEVGYRLRYERKFFEPYLKLVTPVFEGELACIQTTLYRQGPTGDQWLALWTPEFKEPVELSTYPELIWSSSMWPLGYNLILVDSEQTMWWKVMIRMRVNIIYQLTMRLRTASISNLQKNLALLLDDSRTADLKIICNDGVELGAHKTILCARNPIFASMLTSDMIERNTGVLRVDDIRGSTMKLLLHYLYTGELSGNWTDPENIVEMTYASGKYQLTDFQILLDTVLGKQDHGESNFKLLELANKLSLKNAETRLFQRFKDTINRVANADELFEVFKKFQI